MRAGPGGVPTGKEEVVCLVSGGMHSSVTAWEAVLQGFRVKLVHAMNAEGALLAVAGLYSELAHRADPRGLTLEVIEGGPVARALSAYASSSKEPVFAGYAAGAGVQRRLRNVLAPLYLMPEERFRTEFESLGIRSFDAPQDWNEKTSRRRAVRRFSGRRADVSGVIDGLK